MNVRGARTIGQSADCKLHVGDKEEKEAGGTV
jgi:hypothetical protein